MKYNTEIIIDLPRDQVIELFDSVDNMYKWQKGLKKFEHLSGESGQEGAKSKLYYELGRRKIEMTETITKRNLPDEFHGVYEMQGVWNSFENYFIEEGDKTKWKTISEFKSSSFAMKLMMSLLPGMFKKQTLTTMNDFKEFAEGEKSNQ